MRIFTNLQLFLFISVAGFIIAINVFLRGNVVESPATISNYPANRKTFIMSLWSPSYKPTARLLRSFGNEYRDPFKLCPVKNCRLELNDSKVSDSDAVIFHLHRLLQPDQVPKNRNPDQTWIFFTDESPFLTFHTSATQNLSNYNGLFNLSMTYRSDADIWVPYGKTVRLNNSRSSFSRNVASTKSKFIAIMMSHCSDIRNKRITLVKALQRYIPVDFYGACSNNPHQVACPGHYKKDCDVLKPYKFYLAFENANCAEYITEKVWWNSFEKYAVPVIMGASEKDCEKLLPPNSFIHVDNFTSIEHLSEYLTELNEDDEKYNAYHAWRANYTVLNEHGYFGAPSLHLCHVCEVLNRPKILKMYNDLNSFWSSKDCRPITHILENITI